MGGLKAARVRRAPAPLPAPQSPGALHAAAQRLEAGTPAHRRVRPPVEARSGPPIDLLSRARRLGWRPERIFRDERNEREEQPGGPVPPETRDAVLGPQEVTTETEVPFRFDADEDGVEEAKRVYVRKREDGAGYEAIVNTDPVPLAWFVSRKFAQDRQLAGWVNDVTDELKSSTITENRGHRLRSLFLRIVQRIYGLRGKPRDTTHFRPPTEVQQNTLAQITDPVTGVTETATQYLEVDPLSIVPPQDSNWTGYGVKNPNTRYMVGLKMEGNYVRGHMLNSKLHGPGEDPNLVPISQTLNAAMRTGFEDALKMRINRSLEVVRYRIEADYTRAPLRPNGNAYTGQDRFGSLPGRFLVSIEPYRFQKRGDKGDIANWQLGPAIYEQAIPHVLSFTPRKTTPALNDRTPIYNLPTAAVFSFEGGPQLLEAGDVPALQQRGFGLVGKHKYRRTDVGTASRRERLYSDDNSRIYTADPAVATIVVQGNSLHVVPTDLQRGWLDVLSQRAQSQSLTLALGNAEKTLQRVDRLLLVADNTGRFALPELEQAAVSSAPHDPQLQAQIQGRLGAIRGAWNEFEARSRPFAEIRAQMQQHIAAIQAFQFRLEFPDAYPGATTDAVFEDMLAIEDEAQAVSEILGEIAFATSYIQSALDRSYSTPTARIWSRRLEDLREAEGSTEVQEVFYLLDRLYPTEPRPLVGTPNGTG